MLKYSSPGIGAKRAPALVHAIVLALVVTSCNSSPAKVATPLPSQTAGLITETSIVNLDTAVPATNTTVPTVRAATSTPTVVPRPSATLVEHNYAIAYAVIDNGRLGIRLSDLNGVTSTLASDAADSFFSPKWSPDGLRMAYISKNQATGETQLCVLEVSTPEPFCTQSDSITSFDWSPDSQAIVFSSSFVGGNSRYAIYRLEVTERNPRLLYAIDMRVADLQWSPLGDQIIVLVESGETPLRFVYLLSLNGRLKELALDAVPEFVRWHPNGREILFDNRLYPAFQQRDIHLVAVDGSGNQAITNTGKFTYDPMLSPSGNLMAYQAYSETEKPRIYILDLNSGQIIAASPETTSSWYPSWSPDGKYLAFLSEVQHGTEPSYSLSIFSVDDQQSTLLVNEAVAFFRPMWQP
jgi:Tol biopolymer transport system component